MRVNREIRAPKVRVIGSDGKQIGIISSMEAMRLAEEEGLDLVEISPNANPPVCKIVDYGKFRYQQTKKEKESKKSQHQIKVKEIKVKPNIDKHDLDIKLKHARDFIEKGYKVKVTCMFRGREVMFIDLGHKVVNYLVQHLQDVATPEGNAKMFGKSLLVILAPGAKKNYKQGSLNSDQG
ncbi:MAG: translation initiation factor IF-3 [Simkaniaceae bacterium]|nr:translation initiation factor IF-3 [Simkaniaceae bacterium]MCF7851779.1 translation initiation factor IF-3 [Simkaniaceae bacterium]